MRTHPEIGGVSRRTLAISPNRGILSHRVYSTMSARPEFAAIRSAAERFARETMANYDASHDFRCADH